MMDAMNGKDEFGLSPKQRKFLDLYLGGMYATKALRAAGYDEKYANKHAHRMLQREDVRAYVRTQREQMAKDAALQRADLVKWLWRVIITPISQAIHESDLLEYDRTRTLRDGTVRRRVRMVNKMAAIRQLTALMGWDKPEKPEVHAGVDGGELMEIVRRQRAKKQEMGRLES
jgi:hypothetical protein